MKVGVIGLGAMGLPMAKNIIRGGHQVFVMEHRRREPVEELTELGAEVLSTPADIARECEAVITILPADSQLVEVVLGEHGLKSTMDSQKVLIEMTTATSDTMMQVASELESTGAMVLDAPVSGGTPKAASGELTIIAGGPAETLDRYRSLIECVGTTVFHVGPVGAGKAVKMINQMMAATHMAIIGEAFALAERSGVESKVVADVIRQSSGYSRMLDLRLDEFLLAHQFQPGFRLDLMKKDIDLAVDTAQRLNVPISVTSAVAQLYTAAMSGGRGSDDFSSVGRHIAEIADVAYGRHTAAATDREEQ